MIFPVLIIGGDSAIAKGLAHAVDAADGTVLTTSRRVEAGAAPGRVWLDLAEPSAHWPELPTCECAVICAAITSLSECERQPELACHINIDAVRALAERFAASGTYTVLLSTNQVFDGRTPYPGPDTPPTPANAYGAQKAAAEQALLESGAPGAVLRLGKVLNPPVGLFDGWAAKLCADEGIEAFDDMWLSPVSPASAVAAIVRMLERRLNGIHQLTAPDQVSYFTAAQQLAAGFPASRGRVVATSAHDTGLGHLAPTHVTLDTSSLTAALGVRPARAQEVLSEYFDANRAAGAKGA